MFDALIHGVAHMFERLIDDVGHRFDAPVITSTYAKNGPTLTDPHSVTLQGMNFNAGNCVETCGADACVGVCAAMRMPQHMSLYERLYRMGPRQAR